MTPTLEHDVPAEAPTSTLELPRPALGPMPASGASAIDPFADPPRARLRPYDRLVVAGLWLGAGAMVATGVRVQVLEHEISRERCFGALLDFHCTRITRTMSWGQLGGLVLWGSGMALATGGASRLRRSHVDGRARRRAAIVLLVLGGVGVAAASIVPSVAARDCEDVDCFAGLTLARIVATDAAMVGVTLGGALLASTIRPRSPAAAVFAPHTLLEAIARAFRSGRARNAGVSSHRCGGRSCSQD